MTEDFVGIESLRGHYRADACIFWCFDARFSEAYEAFLAAHGFAKNKIDLVKIAGGAQALAGDGAGTDSSFARSQLAKSMKLHHATRVILMVHMDCGAYGGSAAFDNDRDREWAHHVDELRSAASCTAMAFPEIKTIECWIADFDGVKRIG